MKCKGCEYRRPISPAGRKHIYACHYCLDTGVPRLVPADDCYANKVHYRPKKNSFTPVPFMESRETQQARG